MQQFIDNIIARFTGTENIIYSSIDLFFTVLVVYIVVLFLRKNNASRMIKYIALIAVIGVLASKMLVKLPFMGMLFSNFVVVILFVIFVLFPQELKRNLWKMASPKYADEIYTTDYGCSDEELITAISDIVKAAQNMSKKDIGALIIIAPDNIPDHILDSGTRLNADLSCQLIESIFNVKAPLHDGAVYINGNKILAAGCFLPLTQQANLDKDLGTRHRAAIGITEQFNHLAIIVSEETGIISVARHGDIERYMDTEKLTSMLKQVYGLTPLEDKKVKRNRSTFKR